VFKFFIPLFSVTALFVTSVYIVVQAIQEIRNQGEIKSDVKPVNGTIMFVFSVINLLIDVLSLFFFARVNALLGFKTIEHPGYHDVIEQEATQIMEGQQNSQTATINLLSDNGEDHRNQSNTNMCSAYTHVIADTMRSIAVMLAAILSQSNKNISSEVADAWAAILVSAIIFFSILPLLKGLQQKYHQLYFHNSEA